MRGVLPHNNGHDRKCNNRMEVGIYSFIKLNTNFPPLLHNCSESKRATKQISHRAKKALNIICRRGSWVFNRYQAIGSLFPHPFSAFYCGKECSGCLSCETSNIVDCPAVYKWQLTVNDSLVEMKWLCTNTCWLQAVKSHGTGSTASNHPECIAGSVYWGLNVPLH